MSPALHIKYLAATMFNKILPLAYLFKRSNNRYIFAYHRVVSHEKAQKFCMQNSMWITPETFTSDLDWMIKHGDIVDLDTILDFSYQNSKPLFSITFDDGWADNYENAYPILKNYSVPATIFLVTNAIETGNIFWVEDFLYKVSIIQNDRTTDNTLNQLKHCAIKYGIKISENNTNVQSIAENFIEQLKPINQNLRHTILMDAYEALKLDRSALKGEILTWKQINEMHSNGINFGSHTHTHEILQYVDTETALRELETSKNIISIKLKKNINYFCYPNARYNSNSPEYVKRSGYSHAFRIHNLPISQKTNPYLVPRFLLNEAVCKNKNYLMCKLLKLPKF